jgi:hypothetical protein
MHKIKSIINRLLIVVTGRDFNHNRLIIKNRLKQLFKKQAKHKFLFILSPAYCGSTLIHQVVSTSQNVSPNNTRGTREGQTLPIVSKIMFDHDKRWDSATDFDWPRVKKEWMKYWDTSKTVLLEKSPPNIVRAASIATHFQPAYFIIFTRDPYAHCHGIMRRHDVAPDVAARLVLEYLNYQVNNAKKLPNSVNISYEELTDQPQSASKKLKELLPELKDVDPASVVSSKNFRQEALKLTNLNAEKIAQLSEEDIQAINAVFTGEPETLNFFGYRLLS